MYAEHKRVKIHDERKAENNKIFGRKTNLRHRRMRMYVIYGLVSKTERERVN